MCILAPAVAVNLGILFYFKYAFFVASNLPVDQSGSLIAWLKQIALPIGISFFTFQAISYLVDVYNDLVKPEKDPLLFGGYLSFFPQLIAGPVVRYSDVTRDFHSPRTFAETFAAGCKRFSHGLFKKLFIADSVAVIADACFAVPNSELTFSVAAIGALAYTLQIYFDFSAYSDMAIGLGLMFGIRFKENFRHPYSAHSITEFWRRWHISLSQWFRDYLYIPLGGNRHGAIRTYTNLMIVFFLTGLWHGAAWTFILWGMYHGLFLVLERITLGKEAPSQSNPWLRIFYTIPIFVVGWIIFRAETFSQLTAFLTALTSPLAPDAFSLPASVLSAGGIIPFTIMIVACLIFLAPKDITAGMWLAREPTSRLQATVQLCYMLMALTSALVLSLTATYSPFLYFRF